MTPDRAIFAFVFALLCAVAVLWGAAAWASQCALRPVAEMHHAQWGLSLQSTVERAALDGSEGVVVYDLWTDAGKTVWLITGTFGGMTCAMARGASGLVDFLEIVARIRGEARL